MLEISPIWNNTNFSEEAYFYPDHYVNTQLCRYYNSYTLPLKQQVSLHFLKLQFGSAFLAPSQFLTWEIPVKVQMWQNFVALVVFITFILWSVWLYILFAVIADHQSSPTVSHEDYMRLCAYVIERGGGLMMFRSTFGARQIISYSSVTDRDTLVLSYAYVYII